MAFYIVLVSKIVHQTTGLLSRAGYLCILVSFSRETKLLTLLTMLLKNGKVSKCRSQSAIYIYILYSQGHCKISCTIDINIYINTHTHTVYRKPSDEASN